MNEKKPDFGNVERIYLQREEQFNEFFSLLLEYNARFNLTSITEKREAYFKHFLDSLAGEEYFPHGARAVEVGSGAGFPSIPLMIAREDLSFTLIESTGKKCEFLRTACRALGLKAEVLHKRAEEVGKDPAYREKFDVCCARAVARLNTLAEYCLPLVKKGGTFIAYKGAEGELVDGKGAIITLGGGMPKEISYELPEGFGTRTLVITQKMKNTPPKYPRGNGAERRNPLV